MPQREETAAGAGGAAAAAPPFAKGSYADIRAHLLARVPSSAGFLSAGLLLRAFIELLDLLRQRLFTCFGTSSIKSVVEHWN